MEAGFFFSATLWCARELADRLDFEKVSKELYEVLVTITEGEAKLVRTLPVSLSLSLSLFLWQGRVREGTLKPCA